MTDCERCNPKEPEPTCSNCSGFPWYITKTDTEGRCLKCHKQIWPDGARPLTEEEKDVNK